MKSLVEAHYLNMRRQGSIFSLAELQCRDKSKLLIASSSGEVFYCTFVESQGVLHSIIRVLVLPGISDCEIISIDAFKAESSRDEFYIGVVTKIYSIDDSPTYSLHVLGKLEDSNQFDLETLPSFCIPLDFVPYEITHVSLFDFIACREKIVWILSGEEVKCYEKSSMYMGNNVFGEMDTLQFFPEFGKIHAIVLWLEVKRIESQKRRITAYGCENGDVKFYLIDENNATILTELEDQYDFLVSRILFFPLFSSYETKIDLGESELQEISVNILMAFTIGSEAVVYKDVINYGLDKASSLPESDGFDVVTCACAVDIDMDGKVELFLGTSSELLLVYRLDSDDKFVLFKKRRMSDPLLSIQYMDLTGDGVKELLVLTQNGMHILQHCPEDIFELFEIRCDEEELNKFIEKESELHPD